MNTLRLLIFSFTLITTNAYSALIVDSVGNISDLNVNGNLYDVTWNFGNSNPSATDFSLFNGNQAFANDFMDAVLAAFNSEGFTGANGQQYYGVDYDTLIGPLVVDVDISSLNTSPMYRFNSTGHGTWGGFSDAGWGKVEAVESVPAPAPIVILGLGLTVIGWQRRKTA